MSKIEDRSIESMQGKEQREERIKKNEGSLRNGGQHLHTNIHVMGVPEREERNEKKKYLKKQWLKNFQIYWKPTHPGSPVNSEIHE